MNAFVFYLDIFLSILLSVSVGLTFAAYIVRQEKVFVYAAGYLLFILLIELCIHDSEIRGPLSAWMVKNLGKVSIIKSVYYFGCAIIITLFVEDVTSFKLNLLSFIPSLLVFTWFVFLLLVEKSPLHGWLYIFPYQLFTAGISFFAIKRLKKYRSENKRMYFLFRLTLIFSLLIFIEDTIVAFVVHHQAMRNFTETVLWVIYSVFAVVYATSALKSFQTVPFETVEQVLETSDSSENDTLSAKSKNMHQFAVTFMLTNRELELLPLLLENKSYQEISETLHISVGTVKAHNHNIYSKTDVSNRNELIECYQSFSMAYVAEHHDVEIQQVAYSN